MNPENSLPSEGSRTQQVTCPSIPLIGRVQERPSVGTEGRLLAARRREEGETESGALLLGIRFPLVPRTADQNSVEVAIA